MKNKKEKMRFAVIGDPIEHSLSPSIHLPVLNRLARESDYFKVNVKKGKLEGWIKTVLEEQIDGFNVTMPHKTDIIDFLDELKGDALAFRSVNTVVSCGGSLVGYNTDGEGFHFSLKETGLPLKGSNLLLFGSGGVARTLAIKAALEGAKSITILARSPDKAKKVAKEIVSYGAEVHYGSLAEADYIGRDTNILINATPLGMAGMDGNFINFSFLDRLVKGSLVFDLIYRPMETRLLAEAKARDLGTQNGLGMLIYQGLLADRLFLGKDFDLNEMYQEIKLTLEGKVDR